MTLNKALALATKTLASAEIEHPHIEAELLLCHILGISKAQLYSEPEKILSAAEINKLKDSLQHRLLRKPISYITKYCEFYGIELYVDQRVLIPRPETELLVEKALEFAHQRSPSENQFTIADIGTGSGAIAISLSLALPQAKVYATDISASALQVASINCQRHKVNGRVVLLQGNLLEPLPHPVDVIIANLPYIKDCELESLSPEIRDFEPGVALLGGEDGLDKIRQILDQIPGKIRPGACFLLEIGQEQDEAVTSLINKNFPQANVDLIPDLSGINRVVKAIL